MFRQFLWNPSSNVGSLIHMLDYKRSRSFKGGSKTYVNAEVPSHEGEVAELLEQFIRDKFPDETVAEDIRNGERRLIFMVGDVDPFGKTQPPTVLGRDDGELVAYGAFVYPATNHSVQTIWENKFAIRDVDDGVLVSVSSWYGTTVEGWNKKEEREELWL